MLLWFRVMVMLRFLSSTSIFLVFPPLLLLFALNLHLRLASDAFSGMVNTDVLLFLLPVSCVDLLKGPWHPNNSGELRSSCATFKNGHGSTGLRGHRSFCIAKQITSTLLICTSCLLPFLKLLEIIKDALKAGLGRLLLQYIAGMDSAQRLGASPRSGVMFILLFI
jgi:hypothetical protein